ncbi:MAG TPA: hydroxymethylglutaryl-CoA lyase, partial [Bacillus sp. (in: firmicutes)]|nr:hydroxymethylglutaryl-CoA lyase [Bacillus sp. (in: firmicutes)]
MSSEFAAIIEVGARDGLQNEKQFVPTKAKIRFIQLLKEAGFKEMELTSFVSPKWVPQLQDSKEIVKAFQDETRNIVLTPNEKGIDTAKALNCEAIAVFVGVSNTFNQKNINKTTSESMNELKPLLIKQKQDDLFVRACISTSFYCPYEGKIEERETLSLCEQFAEAGVDELSVADTIGMANPKEVYSLFTKLKNEFPHILLTGHFHDTRGMALANIYAALEAGV